MLDAIDHREEIAKLTHTTALHERRINTLEVAHNGTVKAIDDLKQFFLNQDTVIAESVGDLKKSVDAVIAHVTPMVDREEKVKSFILKWSIPTICSLLLAIVCIVYFGDHAAEIGEFVKAVK